MAQFDLTAIANFIIAILSFMCAVSFFLYSHAGVADFLTGLTRVLNIAWQVIELKGLAALVHERKRYGARGAMSSLFVVESSDLMENFSFFHKLAVTGIVLCFIVLLLYAFILLKFYRNTGKRLFLTIFYRLSFRIVGGMELTYSKISIVYFSIFTSIMLSNVFGLIPFSYTITSGLGMPLIGGAISFLMTVGILGVSSGLCAAAGFLPTGTSREIAPLVVIVEVLSFFAKFASLIIRLFANLFAGHLLLKVLYVGIFALSTILSFITLGLELIFFSFVSAVLGLEVILAVLQALVFLALALIYYKDARQFVYAH